MSKAATNSVGKEKFYHSFGRAVLEISKYINKCLGSNHKCDIKNWHIFEKSPLWS